VRRALVLCDGVIERSHLSLDVQQPGAEAKRDLGLRVRARVDALESELFTVALGRTSGNQTRAADMLGLSRFGLQKMMKRLGIRG
jgi:DNA-binding NtrC family response regulator